MLNLGENSSQNFKKRTDPNKSVQGGFFFIEINSRSRTFKIGTAEWFENSKYVSACKNDIPILKHLKGLLSRPKAEL